MKDSHKLLVETMFTNISFALSEHGFSTPMYIMILADNSIMPIVLEPDVEVSLEQYAAIAVDAATEVRASAMVFTCEQTMVSKAKDDPELRALLEGTVRASEHPDGVDHLTAIYMDKNGDCESLIAKIHTDSAGTKFTREHVWMDGSVTNMLSPWNVGN